MGQIKEKTAKENIGLIIRKKRIENKLSQLELSEGVGVSRIFVNLVENGRRAPSYDTLSRISNHLGIKLDDMIKQAEEGSNDPEKRIPYLLAKLIKSNDSDKLQRLLDFIESLE